MTAHRKLLTNYTGLMKDNCRQKTGDRKLKLSEPEFLSLDSTLLKVYMKFMTGNIILLSVYLKLMAGDITLLRFYKTPITDNSLGIFSVKCPKA